MTILSQADNLGDWIKEKFGDQGGLADALKPKVAKNTVSSWKTGRNGIPPDYQRQIRKLGYAGPWPEIGGDISREDLEALRNDLRGHQAWVREELGKELQALGAILHRIQSLLEPPSGNRVGQP